MNMEKREGRKEGGEDRMAASKVREEEQERWEGDVK